MKAIQSVYKGKILHLYTLRKRLPNGTVAAFDMIRHSGAVLIVPFLDNDTLVLIRQYRPVIDSYIWEFPAGNIEKNEDSAACALRELKEETGYQAKKITKLGAVFPVPGYSTEEIIIYKAAKLTKVPSRCEADEVIETNLVSRKKLRALMKRGEIVDAKTICALSFAKII